MKLRNIGYRIILLSLIIIFSIFISEIFLRFYNYRISPICPKFFNLDFYPYYKISSIDGLIYEIEPGVNMQDDAMYDCAMQTNSYGFREKDYSPEKDAGVLRIVGIGDSMCYGACVEFNSRFLKLLEKKLNKDNNLKYKRVETINCGVSGYNLTQDFLNLKYKALKYNPDIIVCSLWTDDLLAPYIPSFCGRSFLGRAQNFLITYSVLWQFLYSRFYWHERYDSKYVDRHIEKNLASLEKIIDLASRNNINIIFILHSTLSPNYSWMKSDYSDIVNILNAKNMPWFEMHPRYMEYLGKRNISSIAIAPNNPHPNAEGNRVISDALLEQLRLRKYL